jgi:RHS repeat-associated protein
VKEPQAPNQCNGDEWEHFEYAPYGETWVTDENVSQSFGYRFTSKELDESTGLYNFGKRYHDPEAGRWLSCDPAFESYLPSTDKESNKSLPGQGGVYNPTNLNCYNYSNNNPVLYTDPDGKSPALVAMAIVVIALILVNGSHTQSQSQQIDPENLNYTGVKITRNTYPGVTIPESKWVSPDGNTMYYGDVSTDASGDVVFVKKSEVMFKDKIEIIQNGKVLYTAQVQSTPDLSAHPNGLDPYTVPAGKYEKKGSWNGHRAKIFPFAVLIHGKVGASGRANSLGCTVTYDNSDLEKINDAIKQIMDENNKFDVWVHNPV